MPAFPAGATVVVERQPFSMTYVWLDGTTKTRILKEFPSTVVIAELEELAERSAGLSNAGLIRYQGAGVKREIAINSVLVYDEAHGISDSLILTFQNEATLDTKTWDIPAPDAALFTSGVVLKPADDAEQGARILATIDAYSAVVNKGIAAGSQWLFVSGYLSTAKASEKRKVPSLETIEEPAAGTPADDPAETPAP